METSLPTPICQGLCSFTGIFSFVLAPQFARGTVEPTAHKPVSSGLGGCEWIQAAPGVHRHQRRLGFPPQSYWVLFIKIVHETIWG